MNEIDVSKCIHKYYVDGEQICGIYESDYVECSKENCYYKQLQQYKNCLDEIFEIIDIYGNNGIELSVEKQECILQKIKEVKGE